MCSTEWKRLKSTAQGDHDNVQRDIAGTLAKGCAKMLLVTVLEIWNKLRGSVVNADSNRKLKILNDGNIRFKDGASMCVKLPPM